MKLTFLGGADEVGASCTLVEVAGKRILVDAGIRISPRSSRGIQNSQLPDLQPISASGGPDYILVTHAHTDHTGALPLVLEQYPHVPVLMTRPTETLTRVLQQDAQKIMRSKHEEEGELPLFDQVSVDALMDAIQIVEFNTPIKLGEGLQATFVVSGHIAGAGSILIESTEGTLVMSGDLSLAPQRTVNSAVTPKVRADVMVLESTYGGRMHANRDAEERRLIDTLMRVTERGGKVLIPAFALGRAQEVIQIILAYRDRLDVPVWVDGMVRSVCDAYARFGDLIPDSTTRAAGEDHLFFREKVKPVRSRAHREEVANSAGACIVVASSGMLTGGASVAYAKHFAGDERNAILLTGYQDEEAPGRFLQRIMREKESGETPTLRLGDASVKVRCEIDTYSLSAHADEQELVNMALAYKAGEVMLVHGDASARHSLASALRRRQIVVSSPTIGTTREFTFKERPWAVGGNVQQGQHQGAVNLEEMWDSLKSRAGDFFDVRELAQVWWGDSNREREMQSALQSPDNIYFSADWRNKSTYRVQSAEQVGRMRRRRAIMLANPDIVGKLVVLRNSNHQPRLGVVLDASIDAFEADVHNTKGRHYPADALLWVIGNWDGYGDKKGKKAQLAEMYKVARANIDRVLPFHIRQQLVQEDMTVLPDSLLPDPLPEGMDRQLSLVSIVLGLANDNATLEQNGLKPQRALDHGPLEQNEAREIALNHFPDDARLRKVGMEVHRKRLTLTFDFPQSAQRRYADEIENLIELTGWDVEVRPTVNQQALSEMLAELLPDDGRISKGPSYYLDKREVQAEVTGVEDKKALSREFFRLTDFKLTLTEPKTAAQPANVPAAAVATGEKLEINAAYGVIKMALEPHGLYKTSLKQGDIVLSFVSPQQGERHRDTIAELSQQIGYTLRIHPHPNQQQILAAAKQILAREKIDVRKGPGIHVDRGTVAFSTDEPLDDETAERLSAALDDETGYTFEVN